MATREAVIVSTARTPIGKAYRGADRVGGEGGRGGCVERAAIGLADRRAGGGNDDCVAGGHVWAP